MHGIERTGLTSIEHFIPQSADTTRVDAYENCLYACRFCNGARHDAPVTNEEGHQLLDPGVVGWAAHFRREEDSLRPIPGDRDAGYTHDVYDLDDPRKRVMRKHREETIRAATAFVIAFADHETRLLGLLEHGLVERTTLLDQVFILRQHYRAALRELLRFAAVPMDAPEQCRCGATLELPSFLAEQCNVFIDLPA